MACNDLQSLIDLARPLVGEIVLSCPDMTAGTVACAIRSASGSVYTGVCIDISCGIGFCAEHAAVAEMIKGRQTQVVAIVAVSRDGVLAPCGRCRELLVQIDARNLAAEVGLPGGRACRLRHLLPEHWLFDNLPPAS